jgi:2-keto-4-pentenoate hydratase
MDPMIDRFVRDRTEDLQRVAATIQRERELRSTETIAATTTDPATRLVAVADAPAAAEAACDGPCEDVAVRSAA